VEITSGGQRCHTYEDMVEGIESKGMHPENFNDYLTVFKNGSDYLSSRKSERSSNGSKERQHLRLGSDYSLENFPILESTSLSRS